MDGTRSEDYQVRAGPGSHQGDGRDRPLPGGTESLGLHSVESTGKEGPGHGSTAPIIGRVEGGDQDAASSGHDRRSHPQVCAHAEARGERHSPGRGLHVSADDEGPSRKDTCGDGQASQLGGAVTDRPTPATRKAPAQPSGEGSSRTAVVGSSGSPRCQQHTDRLAETLNSAPVCSNAKVKDPPMTVIERGVGDMGLFTNTRQRSPHGRTVNTVPGDVDRGASPRRDFSEVGDAANGEGERQRGVPTELDAGQRAQEKENNLNRSASSASAPACPATVSTQTTLPWQATRRDTATDSASPAYCLRNRSNYCYLNSVAVSLHWALLSADSHTRDYGSLGPAIAVLNRLKKVELATRATWKALLQGWRRPAQQHDVTELMSFVMDQNSPLVAGEWQARCVEPGRDIICDRGSTSPFISLDIQGKNSLREALISWHEQHYRHAISAPPILLAIQLGRFRHNGRRTVKIRTPCDIPPALELPFFRDNQLECGLKSYRLCGGIVHVGDLATSGHYRPFCVHRAVHRLGSEVASPNDSEDTLGPYTLYDDDRPPMSRSLSTDSLLRHNTYVVFYLSTRSVDRSRGEPGL